MACRRQLVLHASSQRVSYLVFGITEGIDVPACEKSEKYGRHVPDGWLSIASGTISTDRHPL